MPDSPNKLSQFWQELKRRKVVRVITVYAAAAFVILELVDIVSPSLRLPEWTMNLVIVLLCIGFIIAVILSWIYDIHPEGGIVKTEPAHKAKDEGRPVSSSDWKIASYISFVVIITLIVLNIIPRTNRSDIKEILNKSIAVLPFINDSPDEENAYFINGTMEAIIDNLCKIEDLRVVGRTSVEQYRNAPKPIRVIAEEMDVSYVLEGSGQKDGNKVRLTLQLIDGINDQHLWSSPYIREIEMGQIFDLQSEIAELVAGEIKAVITPEEKQLIEKVPTTSLTAYDFYQRGREELEKSLPQKGYAPYRSTFYLEWLDEANKKALDRAEDYYHKALEYDSAFALAYTGLAQIYWDKNYWETYMTEEFLDSALTLADIALSFDPQLSDAYVIRGDYYQRHNQNEQALKEYDMAIKFNPNEWRAYYQKGDSYFGNDYVIYIDNLQRAASLQRGLPLPGIYRGICIAYAHTGFKKKAIDYAMEAYKLDEDSAQYYNSLGEIEDINGNFEKAIEFLEKSYAIDSTDTYVIRLIAQGYLYLDRFEESLEYYKKFEERLKTINRPSGWMGFTIGYAYWVNGFKKKADIYFNTWLEFRNEITEMGREGISNYSLARYYAFRGDRDKAYEYLRLISQRPRIPLYYIKNYKNNPLFDSIRDEPEFQQFLQDIEAKYQAEHERVRQWLEENEML